MSDFLDLNPNAKIALIKYLAGFISDERLERFDAVLDRRTRHITVMVEDIFQPHNASAVLRSCECFGVQDVHVAEGRNRFRPNTAIAVGAWRWLTIHRYGQGASPTRRCLSALRSGGYELVAMTLRPEATPVHKLPLERPLALCFGTEEEGLSATAHDMADRFAYVPMYGFTQSFNVSVSAALCLAALRTRLDASDIAWGLTPAERRDVRLTWLLQSVRGAGALARRFLADGGVG